MTKRTFQLSGTVLLGLAMAAGPMWGQNIRKREKRQQERIAQGVKSGELTPKETAKIERKEAKLHREIKRDRADGGGLSPQERAKITRQQNRASREIYREKHDNQTQQK
jgi:hypothetical protein